MGCCQTKTTVEFTTTANFDLKSYLQRVYIFRKMASDLK